MQYVLARPFTLGDHGPQLLRYAKHWERLGKSLHCVTYRLGNNSSISRLSGHELWNRGGLMGDLFGRHSEVGILKSLAQDITGIFGEHTRREEFIV